MALLLVPSIALGQEGGAVPKEVLDQFGATAEGAGAGQQEASLEIIVARIINATFGLVGTVLVAYFTYAGWLWMTAQGESEPIEKAQKIIRNAIIGLIITLSAYAISRFVVTALIRATTNVR
jgi:hypothetical protein